MAKRMLVVLAVALLAGCGGGSSGPEAIPTTTAATTASSSTTMTSETPSTTATPREGCYPADLTQIQMIEIGLRGGGDGVRLGEAYADDLGMYRYIGGNVYDQAGARLSSSDVWVIADDEVYSLSGGARDLSNFPDGRGLGPPGGLSAGDTIGSKVQACVQGS